MKKMYSLMLFVIFVFVLFGCTQGNMEAQSQSTAAEIQIEETTPVNLTKEHQSIAAYQVSFDDGLLRVSVKEAGLENVFIREASTVTVLDEDTYGQVYLLADDRYGATRGVSDHYIAIAIDNTIIVEDVSVFDTTNLAAYSGNIELCDLDGDGDNEIILQECVAMSGGIGGYRSRVFDYADGKVTEVFSYSNSNDEKFDTGYSIVILKNRQFKINNKHTGYCEVFTQESDNEEYFKYWYKENGEAEELSILVDSFYGFSPVDFDGDGIMEIACRQYVSLIGHSNGIGWAKTILKYNQDSSAFEIVDTKFEPFH